LELGDAAPPVVLPDLAGREVALADFRGRETLVLFWRPGCGFCQQMLAELKEWEARAPAGAPRLVLISSEGVAANAAQGLAAPILLDEGFGVGETFGVTGTPSAVLVDAEGYIASQMAVGAPAVFALAKAARARVNGHATEPPVQHHSA
jgi:peroxiredoxin